MFVCEKRINGYTYLYLVETVREDGRAKQRIIKNLGRKEALVASGTLERLPGLLRRPLRRAGRGPLATGGRQSRGARLQAHRRPPAVRAAVG